MAYYGNPPKLPFTKGGISALLMEGASLAISDKGDASRPSFGKGEHL